VSRVKEVSKDLFKPEKIAQLFVRTYVHNDAIWSVCARLDGASTTAKNPGAAAKQEQTKTSNDQRPAAAE